MGIQEHNFHLLEVVSRYRDPQLQVGENMKVLFESVFCQGLIPVLRRHTKFNVEIKRIEDFSLALKCELLLPQFPPQGK